MFVSRHVGEKSASVRETSAPIRQYWFHEPTWHAPKLLQLTRLGKLDREESARSYSIAHRPGAQKLSGYFGLFDKEAVPADRCGLDWKPATTPCAIQNRLQAMSLRGFCPGWRYF